MTGSSPIKANLKIVLHAGNTIVAESEDAVLWQKILNAITNQQAAPISERPQAEFAEDSVSSDLADPLQKFDKQLGVTSAQLEGACAPSLEAPYIYLDNQHWEAIKKKLPARGSGSVSNIALAATILCLWFKHAKISGQPTIKDCQAVLSDLGTPEANPSRSLKNTSWLQNRNGGIQINPAETSKAIEVARLFCLKTNDSKAA